MSLNLLALNLLMLWFLFCSHVLLCRMVLNKIKDRPGLRQRALILTVVWLNLPLTIGVGMIAWVDSRTWLNGFGMWIYSFFVFNGLGYTYFHLFNLSETGRRVRMLIEVLKKKELAAGELKSFYSPEGMITVRLNRLVSAGQVRIDEAGGHYMATRLMVWVVRVMDVMRACLGFK